MPCNSSYMEANSTEIEASRALCLLGELKGNKFSKNDWQGYHKGVYNNGVSKDDLDGLVASLCSKLQKVDVTMYSLEMQLWWRDHQAADKAREERETAQCEAKALRKQAVAKLTPKEIKALGLKEE